MEPKTRAMALEGILTRAQLAIEFEISEQLIALWEKDGLPVLKIGQKRMYDTKEVGAWLRKAGR